MSSSNVLINLGHDGDTKQFIFSVSICQFIFALTAAIMVIAKYNDIFVPEVKNFLKESGEDD